MAKMNNWIIREGYDNLGGYSATMQISDELNPEYLEQVCNDAFTKFYMRPSYFIREVKRKGILKKGHMILKNIRSKRSLSIPISTIGIMAEKPQNFTDNNQKLI